MFFRRAVFYCCGLLVVFFVVQQSFGQINLTVEANTLRSVGGTGDLDRAQFFNHWGTHVPPTNTNLGNLARQVWETDELHSVTGRETFELDWFSRNVPQDPSRPGFFQQAGLANAFQGSYRSWVLSNQRWESLRVHSDPIFVQSGRANGAWPSWIKDGTPLPIANNGASFAEVLNAYLEEVVYGTGPNQGYLPFDKDRFYVEIMNEPQWEGVPWNDVIEMHRTVTEMVKEAHPEAKIGGVSCCTSLDGNPLNTWTRMQQMMDDMVDWQTSSGQSVEFDFWSIHPYERYSVLNNGSHVKDVELSPGHLSALMDLYESYSHQLFDDPKAFAVTEYGSWNRTNLPNQDYGSYSRAEQQWDLVRDIREKLMIFMDRPDRIVNATPFVAPQWYTNNTPTDPDGDPVFWEKDANGAWNETIVASMYRLYNDLSGRYVEVGADDIELQTHAFRDGNKLYVVLNNLNNTSNVVNLAALTGFGDVSSASLDRIFWNGSAGVYEENLDVSSSWQSLALAPEEGAVLTLTLSGPELYDFAIDERTYYGDDTLTPLNVSNQGRSKIINIDADLENAVSAKVRVGYQRQAFSLGEAFDVEVNGTKVRVAVPASSYDDGDEDMVSREVEIPLDLLNDGNNQIVADFFGNGGELISAVLVVDHSIGDFSGNGVFDGEDVSMLVDAFGPAAAGSEYDLVADGVIDADDLNYWLEQLRGTTIGVGADFDLDNDIDDEDLAILRANYGSGTHYGQGDTDFDGDVDGADFLTWQRLFGAAVIDAAQAASVPEPSASVLLLSAVVMMGGRRSRIS